MAYTKAKFQNSSDKASPYFRSFQFVSYVHLCVMRLIVIRVPLPPGNPPPCAGQVNNNNKQVTEVASGLSEPGTADRTARTVGHKYGPK
jgi:hypothetical protein